MVIGRLQNRCGDAFYLFICLLFIFKYFLPTSEIVRDACIRGYHWNQTKFPIHKVWWLREASQIGQTFIPLYEQVISKTQRGRIPIDQAIHFGCNWTSFHRK